MGTFVGGPFGLSPRAPLGLPPRAPKGPVVWAMASVTVIRSFCNGDQTCSNGSESSNVAVRALAKASVTVIRSFCNGDQTCSNGCESSNVAVRALAKASGSGYGLWLLASALA